MRTSFKFVGVVLLWALIGSARAQTPSIPPDSGTSSSGSGTKIPVTSGPTETLGSEASGTSSFGSAQLAIERPINPEAYTCGPGDVFEVHFWGQQNFRLRIAADIEGRAFISKVGFIEVAGKTLAHVRTQAKKKIRQSYPGLHVDLVLATPRTFRVHVVNFVQRPGAYDVNALERLSSVLSKAGGATGSRRRVIVKHQNGKEDHADLVLYELTGDTNLNPYLLDGDVVTVPPPNIVVRIEGAVRRAGSYELVGTKDMTELIQLAGGFTSSAARSLPIRITRRDPQQRARFIDVPFAGSVPDEASLQDDDIVTVPSATEFQRSVLLIGAVGTSDSVDDATAMRRLPFVEGDTVRSLIERAGGIRTVGDLRRAFISRVGEKGDSTIIALDLEALLVRRDFSADKPIMINDTIVIPSLRYSVTVDGAVARSGLVEFNPSFSAAQYIGRAGGRTRTAKDIEDVKVIDTDGLVRSYRADMKIRPGDSILVPERSFTRSEIVQLTFAAAGLILSGVAVTLAATR